MYVYSLLWIFLCGRVCMYVGDRGQLVLLLKGHSSCSLRLTVLELAKKTKLAGQ